MSDIVKHQTLEISGSFLVPSFSIYLLEISKKGKKYFYIGMTGDNFYPSARAAFHRLSGHLEKANISKQNQLWLALKETVGIKTEAEIASLNIKMHHFPIEGFREWKYGSMHHLNVKKYRKTKEYLNYKSIQEEVLLLENALIFAFSSKLLNKTEGVYVTDDFGRFSGIYNSIKNIINV